jgi:RNA recognition motif-containing protein
MREELPLPTKPPYTAFVGNLAFETEEEDLSMFFEGLEVSLDLFCQSESRSVVANHLMIRVR